MMSRTHLTAGIAAALVVSPVTDIKTCLFALAGGAIGGVLPDVDIFDKAHKKDAVLVGLISFGILFGGIFYYFHNSLLVSDVMKHLSIFGLFCFDALIVAGFISEHRHFTHSLFAIFLFSLCVSLVCRPMLIPFAAGYMSHLALDILNKKGMRLLFPLKKGICLRLCYADKLANNVLMILGTAASIVLLGYNIANIL